MQSNFEHRFPRSPQWLALSQEASTRSLQQSTPFHLPATCTSALQHHGSGVAASRACNHAVKVCTWCCSPQHRPPLLMPDFSCSTAIWARRLAVITCLHTLPCRPEQDGEQCSSYHGRACACGRPGLMLQQTRCLQRYQRAAPRPVEARREGERCAPLATQLELCCACVMQALRRSG